MNLITIELDETGQVKQAHPYKEMQEVYEWVFKNHPFYFRFSVKNSAPAPSPNRFYRSQIHSSQLFKILKKHACLETNHELKGCIVRYAKRRLCNKDAIVIMMDYIWIMMEHSIKDFMQSPIDGKVFMICNGKSWSEMNSSPSVTIVE